MGFVGNSMTSQLLVQLASKYHSPMTRMVSWLIALSSHCRVDNVSIQTCGRCGVLIGIASRGNIKVR